MHVPRIPHCRSLVFSLHAVSPSSGDVDSRYRVWHSQKGVAARVEGLRDSPFVFLSSEVTQHHQYSLVSNTIYTAAIPVKERINSSSTSLTIDYLLPRIPNNEP